MLRTAKLALLHGADQLGITNVVLNSAWRSRRLLILCYHGVSLDDEHEWNDSLYMHRDLFRQRMQTLADLRCNVLPFGEALDRLSRGTLPPRAVAITVDDGSYDFYRVSWPILKSFGYPVTLYFTTYYSDFNRPVFDVMCSYLLWKACGRTLEWPGVLADATQLDSTGRPSAGSQINSYAFRNRLSGKAKDELLADLAARLGCDYEALCRRRILHLMTPNEAREIAAEGIDIQLHTHRHRVGRNREKLYRELDDNKARIQNVSNISPTHFCYTGGFYLPEFPGWLREYGVRSATTCMPGLADPNSDPMLLPRFIDTSSVSPTVFRAWVSGLASFLPMRRYTPATGQLIDEDPSESSTVGSYG